MPIANFAVFIKFSTPGRTKRRSEWPAASTVEAQRRERRDENFLIPGLLQFSGGKVRKDERERRGGEKRDSVREPVIGLGRALSTERLHTADVGRVITGQE